MCYIALKLYTQVQSQYEKIYICGEYGTYGQIRSIKGEYDQTVVNKVELQL